MCVILQLISLAAAGKTAYVGSFPGGKAAEVAEEKIKRGNFDGLSRKAKRRKMAVEDDENDASAAAAIRSAKKIARPRKITEPMAKPTTARNGGKVKRKKGSAFDDERGGRKGRHEGMRAKPTKVALGKKGKVSKPPKGKGQSKGRR